MENFNLVSPYQENRFMLALGYHPFQNNNEVKVSRIFTDVYQQNRLILLVNTIIEEIETTYTTLNEDLFSIM